MDITKALVNLRPGAQWSLDGDTYGGLHWLDENQTKPTEEEVNEELKKLKIEYENTKYQKIRAREYPSIGDQLDALFHAGVFPPEMAAQIQAIKDKYPKPE
jgi:hypothetical protein